MKLHYSKNVDINLIDSLTLVSRYSHLFFPLSLQINSVVETGILFSVENGLDSARDLCLHCWHLLRVDVIMNC